MTKYNTLFPAKYLRDRLNLQNLQIENYADKLSVLERWKHEIDSKSIYTKKEEQLQADFLNDIFGKVLGYAYERGLDEINLEKEFKSKTDGTKPDGVLGYLTAENKDIRVVIELKDTFTNLDHKQNRKNDNRTPVEQAFSYVSKSGGKCKWVIVSNFVEIRLYPANDSSVYQSFSVADLIKEEKLKEFYALLAKDNLFIPAGESKIDGLLKLKIEADETITKEFYNVYKTLRSQLFKHIKENNPAVDENTILTKSQKILDRIIFICFCEDLGLLPYKVFKEILHQTQTARFIMTDTRLWEEIKGLFTAIDQGYPQENINRFNGGLFKADDVIDNLVIKDGVLKEILSIERYSFDSDLNVNILGHIFEQSITDLEELKSAINGEDFDKKKGKRKKDGVFYTPEYITRYIVNEAVGGWLEDKKRELGYYELPKIDDDQWVRLKTNKAQKNNKTIKAHLDFWLKYRKALNNIKVLDPACGSGSFLVQVFDYLKEQIKQVNEEIATFEGAQPTLFNYDNHILSHNIYGVDLNAESVEITKLALWLKTANKKDPLTALDDNIKCGNSLIDDVAVAGDKAFDWNKEFAEIMQNGGFDVVVGNPPYFNIDTFGNKSPMFSYLQRRFPDVYMDKSDILFYFINQAVRLIKNNSNVSFIVSNAFLYSHKAEKLRNYLLNNTSIERITNFEKYYVFKDAGITTLIFSLIKGKRYTKTSVLSLKDADYKQDFIESYIRNEDNYYDVVFRENNVFSLANPQREKINHKIDDKHPKLGELLKVGSGMQTASNDTFLFKEIPSYLPREYIKGRMSGEIIGRYCISTPLECLLYIEDVEDFDKLPLSIQQHLLNNKKELEDRADKKRRKTAKWWNYTFPMHKEYYKYDKIWTSYRSKNNTFCYDDTGNFIGLTNTTVVFGNNPDYHLKYILALLNSNLLNYRYKSIGKQTGSGVFEYFENQISKLPIPMISKKKQQPFINLVDIMLDRIKKFKELENKLSKILHSDFPSIYINEMWFDWWKCDYSEFIQQLKKQKITLNGTLKDDWYDRFNRFKQQAVDLKTEIEETDKKIDALVYQLYGLTNEEIKVIENG